MSFITVEHFLDAETIATLIDQDDFSEAQRLQNELCAAVVPGVLLERLVSCIPGPCPTCKLDRSNAGSYGSKVLEFRGAASEVTVPARVCARSVPTHQDSLCDGTVVRGYSAVVYLQGAGTLVLQDDDREVPVPVAPGKLVVWCNSCLTHRLDAEIGSTRIMLGPLQCDGSGQVRRLHHGGGGSRHAPPPPLAPRAKCGYCGKDAGVQHGTQPQFCSKCKRQGTTYQCVIVDLMPLDGHEPRIRVRRPDIKKDWRDDNFKAYSDDQITLGLIRKVCFSGDKTKAQIQSAEGNIIEGPDDFAVMEYFRRVVITLHEKLGVLECLSVTGEVVKTLDLEGADAFLTIGELRAAIETEYPVALVSPSGKLLKGASGTPMKEVLNLAAEAADDKELAKTRPTNCTGGRCDLQ